MSLVGEPASQHRLSDSRFAGKRHDPVAAGTDCTPVVEQRVKFSLPPYELPVRITSEDWGQGHLLIAVMALVEHPSARGPHIRTVS
jgi:hypothetical protein